MTSRFTPDGQPVPLTWGERVKTTVSDLMPLIAAALLLYGAWFLLDEYRSTVAIGSVSALPPKLVLDFSGMPLASPPAFPARLEMVVLDPTPTYAPPKPTSTPSPRPLFCPDDPDTLPNGTVCRGVAPLPVPTEMPTCLKPAVVGADCVVRNSHLGTPEAMPATPIGVR